MMTPIVSSSEVVRRRVVLQHATGRLTGLSQILGVLESTHDKLKEAVLPSIRYEAGKTANHCKSTDRAIYYREWAQAPRGQLNDFNPAQV